MIAFPQVTSQFCAERCELLIGVAELSRAALMDRRLSDSRRLECRKTLESAGGMSGHFIYPPGGGIDWHDDAAYPGWRVYIAWSETGESGMLFDEGGVRRVCQDKPGWNVRQFLAPTWHCVWTDCWRYSVGLYLPCMP
jgi:hypothetical protein